MRRLTESQGAGADAAIALMREEDRLWTIRRLEGTKLGGLITTAVGIGLMIFLGIANDDNHLIGVAIGIVPLMVGLALLLYAYRLSPKLQIGDAACFSAAGYEPDCPNCRFRYHKRTMSSHPDFRPIILAGGSGTRFWPRSRKARAKQVLALDGERTMIQRTLDRLLPLARRAERLGHHQRSAVRLQSASNSMRCLRNRCSASPPRATPRLPPGWPHF